MMTLIGMLISNKPSKSHATFALYPCWYHSILVDVHDGLFYITITRNMDVSKTDASIVHQRRRPLDSIHLWYLRMIRMTKVTFQQSTVTVDQQENLEKKSIKGTFPHGPLLFRILVLGQNHESEVHTDSGLLLVENYNQYPSTVLFGAR